MRSLPFIVTLCHIICQTTLASTKNCLPQECAFEEFEPRSIACTYGSFTTVPDFSKCGIEIVGLIFDTTSIVNLTDNSLPPGLQSLIFLSNPLGYISEGAFNNCATTLVNLTFDMSLYRIIPSALAQLTSLKYLDISYERSLNWNIPVLKQIGRTITFLNIKYLRLSTWPSWLQYFTALSSLEIFHSTLSDINDQVLSHVANQMIDLKVTHSYFTFVPTIVSSLINLDTLSFANNMITKIENLPSKLTFLEFNYNQITEITDQTFSNLTNLQNLLISYNPIARISPNAFANNPLISYLMLEGTNLTRVPLALMSLMNIGILFLDDSDYMVCTCEEASLMYWFNKTPNMQTYGGCGGDIDMKDFFTKLAPGCPEIS
ncbi:unnamed protein product [Lymnaea stagnalis]|uniref:Uncharacterized protein n=1 Tax=Lymnaea stagnalis TaxID=6523 RepID=A0AAV2IJ84_LYMST